MMSKAHKFKGGHVQRKEVAMSVQNPMPFPPTQSLPQFREILKRLDRSDVEQWALFLAFGGDYLAVIGKPEAMAFFDRVEKVAMQLHLESN